MRREVVGKGCLARCAGACRLEHWPAAPGRPAAPVGARRSWLDRLFPGLLLVAVAVPVGLLWGREVNYSADSPMYLAFCRECSATYPLFLDAVVALFGTVQAVANTQLVLNAAALMFCGFALRAALDAPRTALIVVAFLGSWPHLAWWHASVLTESLFVSCICGLIGALALLLRRPAWWTAATVSLACGLATTVRPAGAALMSLLAVVLWLIWRQCSGRRWAIATALILPATLCIWGESVIWQAHHDDLSRPTGIHRSLFAKVLLVAPAPAVADAESGRVIAYGRELMAPGRERVESAPSLQAKIYLLRQLEQMLHGSSDFRYTVTYPSKSRAAMRGQQERDLLGRAARAALLAEPASWLGNALLHWWGQWSSYWLFSPDAERDYRHHADSLAAQPLFADEGLLPPAASTRHLSLPRAPWDQALRWMLFATLAASFAAIGLACLWQRLRRGVADPQLALAALCGLAMHGYFLLCGLFSVATDRYTFSMLPMAAVCATLLLRWALEKSPRAMF